MRALLILILLSAPVTARADECSDLIDRVTAETAATLDGRTRDYASFTTESGTTLTFSCGAPQPSSVGAQFRGESPPDAYFVLFGRAGHAVTGIEAAILEAAAHRAQDAASRLRHSNVEAGGARITCSVSNSDKGRLTMCAVIEQGDRS